jgi:hypothetical protein
MPQRLRRTAPFLGFVLGPVFTGAVHVTKYKCSFYSQPCAASVRYRTQHPRMNGEGQQNPSRCLSGQWYREAGDRTLS